MSGARGIFWAIELGCGVLAGVLGAARGLTLFTAFLSGQGGESPLAFFFAGMAILGALTVALGAWRHAVRREGGWAPPMAAATVFLGLVAFLSTSGGPLMIAATLLALVSVTLVAVDPAKATRR